MKLHRLTLVLIGTALATVMGQTFAWATDTSQNNAVARIGISAAAAPSAGGSSDQLPFTGSFVYNYPIDVPPGLAGLQPNVLLSYNSTAGNGWAGTGWDLSFGSIQRSTKSGIPTYTGSDTYVFVSGGATQELVSSDGGTTNYRAKIEETFLKFAYDGTSWVVSDKMGTRMYFGPTAATRIGPDASRTLVWALQKVVDRNGNYFTISYTSDQGQLYPDTILYTYQAGSTAVHRRVRFVLQSRPDPFSNYRGGFQQLTAKRLSEIDTDVSPSGSESGPWNPVRRYSLVYSTRTNGVRSELSSITVTGTDGTSSLSLPSTQFQYAATATNWTTQADNSPFQLPDYTIVNGRDNGFRFLDLNGDGRVDALRAISINGSLMVDAWLNTPTGWVAAPQWKISDAFVATDQNGAWWDTGIRVADLNGDGYADLIKAVNYDGGFYFDTWINNGNGWTHDADVANQWKVPDNDWSFSVVRSGTWFRDNGVELVDINGDGLPDLVQGLDRDGGTAYDHRRVRFNTGSGWAAADAPSGWNLPTDLTLVTSDGTESVSNGTEIVDLNGDGLPDFVQKIDNNDLGTQAAAAWINRGGVWDPAPQWIPNDNLIRRKSNNALEYGIRYADVNGDGLPDMIQSVEKRADPVLGTVDITEVYANTGSGWRRDTSSWTIPSFFSITNQSDWTTRNWGTGILDVNGDGVPDFYRSYYDANGGTGKSIFLGNSNPELLTRIVSPLGGTTDIAYTNTAALTGHQVPYPVNVVSSVTKNDGRGNAVRVTYAYAGGLFDSVQKEFLGFAQVDATDADGNKTTTFFHQNKDRNGAVVPQNALKGRPYEVDQYDSGGHLLTSQKTQWDYSSPSPNSYFVRATSVQNMIADVTPALTTETDFAYDAYGNVIRTASLGDLAVTGDEKTAVTDYALNAASYLVGFPCHTVLEDANGQAVSESQTFYDGSATLGAITTGNITQVQRRVDMSANRWTTTAMAYDSNGQLHSVTDANGHPTSTVYDAYGFPATVTNALNQSIHSVYDLKTGELLQSTDLNGQTTTSAYDLLGRQTSVVGPLDSTTFPTVQYDYHDALLGNPNSQFTETIARLHRGTSSTLSTKTYFDGLGRTYHVEAPSVNGTVFTDTLFNERGLAFKTSAPRLLTDPNAQYTTTTFDALGRAIRVDHPDNTNRQTTYSGRSVSVQDENGHVQTSLADADGRVVQRTEPGLSHPTIYVYDAAGNVASVTDAAGHTTSFTYDALGRKRTMTDPNAGAWSYQYDDAGHLTQQTDARGVQVTLTYDALNRLSSKVLSADPAGVTGQTVGATLASYAYDEPNAASFPVGHLTTRTDASGLVKFTYDAVGNPVQQDQTVGGVIYTVKTSYDEGQPTQVTYPNGKVVSYLYNSAGQLATVTDGTTTYAAFPNYDALGHITETDLSSNRFRINYTYDPQSQALMSLQTQLVGGSGAPLQNLAYQYDGVKNITSITDNVHPERSQTYHFDALDRLTQAQGIYGTQSFSYDDTGNLLVKDHTVYTYGDAAHPSAVTETRSSVLPGVDGSTLLAWNLDPSEAIHSIAGSVNNGVGQGISTVSVVLSGLIDQAVNTGLQGATNGDGQFEFRGLPGGANARYTLSVSSVGMSAAPAGYAYNGLAADQANQTFVLSTSTSPALDLSAVRIPRTGLAMGSPLPHESSGTLTAGLIGGLGYGGTVSTGGGFSQMSGYSPLPDPADTQQQPTTQYTPPPTANAQGVMGPGFVPGRYEQALSFNGLSDAFVIPGSQSVNPTALTLMIWAKPTNGYPAFGYATLLSKSVDVSAATGTITSGYRLVMDTAGKVRFEIGRAGSAVSVTSLSSLPLNKWTFLSATYDGSQMKLYVNGQPDQTLSTTVPILSNATPVSLAASLTSALRVSTGTLFSGVLDEPRVQSRAWSAVEIADTWEEFDNVGVYTYDADGNRLTETVDGSTTSYRYDADGRLVSLNQDGAWLASYTYDGDGTRVKKTTGDGTTLTLGKLYEERPDGSRIDHVYAGGQLVCDLVTPSAGSAQTYYYLSDHLGSVSLVTDPDGNVVQDTTYEPFGEIYDSSGTSPNHRFYTGQEADDESGLYFYSARYYDPLMGRFVSPDSIVPSAMDPQSMNRYAYCRNNPVMMVDPNGHFAFLIPVALAVAGAAIGGTHGQVFNNNAWRNWDWRAAGIGAAAGAAAGAGIAAGSVTLFSDTAFATTVPTAGMGYSVVMAGLAYSVDANGGNSDTTNNNVADGYRQQYIESRRINPISQIVTPQQLYAMSGIDPAFVGAIPAPLVGLGPQLQVRTKTRSDEDESGTTLYHYGYEKDMFSLMRGIRQGGYATPDIYATGREAQVALSLPIHDTADTPPNSRYIFSIDLDKTVNSGLQSVSVLRDLFNEPIRPGGGYGHEYMFPLGTAPSTFRGFDVIPSH